MGPTETHELSGYSLNHAIAYVSNFISLREHVIKWLNTYQINVTVQVIASQQYNAKKERLDARNQGYDKIGRKIILRFERDSEALLFWYHHDLKHTVHFCDKLGQHIHYGDRRYYFTAHIEDWIAENDILVPLIDRTAKTFQEGVTEVGYHYDIWFAKDEHATMFKLKWG
jgi:hypothetical protein